MQVLFFIVTTKFVVCYNFHKACSLHNRPDHSNTFDFLSETQCCCMFNFSFVSISTPPSWMTVYRSGPWCLLEALKCLSHWREEALKAEVRLKPPHLRKMINSYNIVAHLVWILQGGLDRLHHHWLNF